MKRIAALSIVIAGLALAAFAAGTASAESGIELFASNVQQVGGNVLFDVNSTEWQTSFNGDNTYCDATITWADGWTSSLETAPADDPHDFQAETPAMADTETGLYPAVTGIDFSCDWTRTVSWSAWVTHRQTRFVSATAAYRGKVGPGRVYTYYPGTKTVDNRGSSSTTTAIFRVRHKGRGTYCRYWFSSAFSKLGPRPGISCRASNHVSTVKVKVLPRTMFTLTQIEVRYRWSTYNRFHDTIDMSGEGSWHP